MKNIIFLLVLLILPIIYSCAGSYDYYEYEPKSKKEIEREMQNVFKNNFNKGKDYFFQILYSKCKINFEYVLEDKQYDKYFYGDSVYYFYKQNLNYAIQNKGLQFAEEIAREYKLEEYIRYFDRVKTAKQDSIISVKKQKELQERKWIFYNSGYYEMALDPDNTYSGIDYFYVWYDENSIKRDNDSIYVMCKFGYNSSGYCPTYQYLRYDKEGNRTTIDLYHSCSKVYTGIHFWDKGKIDLEFFELLLSKVD